MISRNARPGSRRRSGPRWLRRLVVAAVIAALSWLGGLIWYAGQIPIPGPPRSGNTEAIVVLTGGSGRLGEGLRLLAEGRAQKLFISGVYRGVDVRVLLQMAARKPDNVECCITLGYAADNTAGNAWETAAWMVGQGYRSLRLVTASYHMPRSLLEFRRTMPDFEILAHAVFPERFRHADWWHWPGSTALVISEYNKYLAALARLGPGRSRSPGRASAG